MKTCSALLLSLLFLFAVAGPSLFARADEVTTLTNFTSSGAGVNPWGEVVQDGAGNLYGTTLIGGTSSYGTAFKITSAGVFSTLFSFTGSGTANPGGYPKGPLMIAADGNIYGMTYGNGNGANGSGTIFSMTTAGVQTNLTSFIYNSAPEGYNPTGGLVQSAAGDFYGVTEGGGAPELHGVFFRLTLTPTQSYTKLVNFGTFGQGFNLGTFPQGTPLIASDGNFYIQAREGGANGFGAVVKITPGGAASTLVSFSASIGTAPGFGPVGSLVEGANGYLYGVTSVAINAGGSIAYGTVFRVQKDGTDFSNLVYFRGVGSASANGAYPYAGLVLANDGNFYGTTSGGGLAGGNGGNGKGTVFRMTPSGDITTIIEFTQNDTVNKGMEPRAALTQGTDGKLYGTTYRGGTGGNGTVFSIDLPVPPMPEIELELVGPEANTALTNEADTVPFDTVEVSSTTTKTFLIKNTGTADLENIQVSLDLGDPDHEQFSVTQPTENSIAPDGSRTFTATYAPNGAGSHTATLRVESNDGDESTFSVELTGAAELVPEITVRDGVTPVLTNAEVELGNVIQGDFVERTFTIQNIGAADLTDLAVTIPNTSAAAAFSQIAFVAPILATNITSTFTIRFRPALLGAHAVTIAVGSNDADENPFNIRLRGMCIAPGAVVGTPAGEASAPADTIGAWATSLAGSYTGLIKDGSNAVLGRVADLKALPVIPRIRPSPTLEGSILFKGRTVAIKAVISPSGAVAATIPTSKAISTGDMLLNLQFFKTNATESPVLRGTVTWLGVTATLDAITSPGTGTLQLLQPTWPGRYTLALPAEDGWGINQPGGDGYASVSILTSGAVAITGYLGDGTVFNTKSVLNLDGRMVIYHDIVRAGVSRGSIAGTLTMRDVAGVSDFDGRLQWTRAKDDGAANYRNGFSVQVWCLGNRYTAPATNTRILSQLPTHDHNARLLVVSPFSASTPESYSLDWTAKNGLNHYGPYFIGSLTTIPLGVMKVSSRPLSTAVIQRTMNMVCLQKQGIAVGYYSTGTLTGRCRIDPGDYPHPGSEYTGAIQRPGQPAVPAVAPAVTAVNNPTTFAGTYSGVVIDDLSRMAGGLEDMIIGSSGSFTATLWLRGVRYGFTGRLFPDGTVSGSIPRTGLPSMTLTLQLYLEDGTTNGYELNGTLVASGSQYTIQSQRLPNYTTVLRSPNEGPYTLAFLALNGVNVATEPGGDGYGNLSVSYLGVCSGTCKLADASTFTFASHVSRSGEWSLHRGIYNGKAWVAGKLTFRDVPNISDLDGEWRWEKQAGAVPASFPYSAGFAVTRPVVGCRYLAPVKGYPAFFQLPASYLNAWVRLSGPDFSTLPSVTLTARDRAMSWLVDDTLISHGPDTMKALLTRSTGVFSGTYTDTPFGVSQAIGGVLLQKQGVVTGHYLHGPASGLVVIMPKP